MSGPPQNQAHIAQRGLADAHSIGAHPVRLAHFLLILVQIDVTISFCTQVVRFFKEGGIWKH